MDPISIILTIIIIVLVVVVVLLWQRSGKSDDSQAVTMLQNQINQIASIQNEKLDRTLKELNDRLYEQNKVVNEQLSKSQQSLQQQFMISQKSMREDRESANKIIKDVTEKLTKLDETNKQVVGFAEQLQSLENILKNPKQRGILGEYFLQTVLENVLPPKSFEMQYKFKNGDIVDAIVRVKQQIIPIDSKFSLENYHNIQNAQSPLELEKFQKQFKQDLKNRIDETSKYIRPEEGTLNFAFMFIPSEGIYYDLLINQVGTLKTNTQDLIEYAFKERSVIIVSPTSFLAYLQTVLQGLRALQIEEQAAEIKKNVEKLRRHLNTYDTYFNKLGKNLTTSMTAYQEAADEMRKIDKDIIKIAGEVDAKPLAGEQPNSLLELAESSEGV